MKCVCLLALTLMLRPSDLEPTSLIFDSSDGSSHKSVFSEQRIHFDENGGMDILFHGNKNDYDRDGFKVHLPAASEEFAQVDPIQCLKDYMSVTQDIRQSIPDRPVILTLNRPYKAVDSSTISTILSRAIAAAGLPTKEYSAKSFRPTGATCAIDIGINPDIARHIGRWRCAQTFEKHYVHARIPSDYLDNVFSHS